MPEPDLELNGEQITARLRPGRGTKGGYSLVVDGATQSHVNPEDPLDLQLEYQRIVAAIVEGCLGRDTPIRALHLGAGALTIPRYLGAAHPGSSQQVVELYRELYEFVVGVLPLDERSGVEVEFDDGRAFVQRARRPDDGFDVAIVDVFSGNVAPRHMSTAEFFAELGDLLAPEGVVIVNTLATTRDGLATTRDGLAMTREVIATLYSQFPQVVAFAAPAVVAGDSGGNVVIAATAMPTPADRIRALADTGPRPIAVFAGDRLTEFTAGAPVRHDSDAPR